MSFNRLILIGNLGSDPDLRFTPEGTAVCSFTVATNERRKNEDKTTWFRVTLWRERAETAAKHLKKGGPVYVEGKLTVEEWQDRDGKNRYTLEVNGTDFQFVPRSNDDRAA